MSQTWGEKNRQRAVLRQIIKGQEALEAVIAISDQLRAMGETATRDDSSKVHALKAAADLKLRVLDKVLPDLKSVEHDMGETLGALTDQELHGRIEHLIRALESAGVRIGSALAAGGSSQTVQ